MPLKPDGKPWVIREQIHEDLVTGLTFMFEVLSNGEFKLHIQGDCLPCGNRDIIFGPKGDVVGSGTGCCAPRPSWLKEVKERDGR